MSEAPARPKLLLIGQVPPPIFGVAQATKLMLESSVLAERVDLVHLDTSDVAGFATMGRLDCHNILLAFKHLGGLTRLLARRSPDVVLLTASQSKFALVRDALFVTGARAFCARVVTYLRGSGYAQLKVSQGWLAARLLRYILRCSSRVLVLSESLVVMAHAVYPPARVVAVPNGCPAAVPAGQAGLRDEHHPVVAYVGRLSRDKGLEDALAAARIIAAEIPALEFVLCGDWDCPAYEAEIRPLIRQYGLLDVVRLPGLVVGQEKVELLTRAWLLLVPSHSEGQPWVILEAMSAALPVVATDTGAITETIADGVSGFVVPVGDIEALAARVTALLRDDRLWKRMAQEALKRYQECFTLSRSHEALADELCRVARGDAPRRPQ